MRDLLKLVIVCVAFFPCNSKPRQSTDSVLRELQVDKRSHEKVCIYVDNRYCSTWRYQGYCSPGNYYYDSMKVHCKATCGFCGEKDCPDHTYCSYWKSLGYCQYGNYYYPYMKAYCPASCGICDCRPQPDSVSDCATWTAAGYCNPNSQYYDYMLLNCQTSCGFCVQPPTTTTKPPSTAPPPPTTINPNTTSKPSTTGGPSTSANLSTTAGPSTTSNPATTVGPITTSNPSSTAGPTTASNSSTTAGPSTTSNPTTTGEPSTTSNPSTTAGPSTTSNPSTTSEPSTTFNPSTTDVPSTTSNPSTTAGPSTTIQSTTVPPTPTPAENACLKAHNDRRAIHGASPLIWNATLAQHAQVWADHIAGTGIIQHDPNRGPEGENIAWFKGHDAANCTNALVGWYDKEEPLYDYSNPVFTPETGHFTQVVWKSTTAVGVAQASTGSGLSKQIYIVARYIPAGNVIGFFKQNVGNKQSN